ncbi:hypothetical protein [Clostridium chromiireducens]|uniref:Uncharacterized protein n=1 Tax=Clostridium chromiireducens TaxID=225345 RepID=A0A1V4I578_9CLOT|nr:hypothetical protein [Clostridium chromiireducens]OPJ54727.1 hypothetical protein CLCHR_47730 [Clostridium chromiireducens]RII32462.1 hypothetical protein D2A34_22585 [Clostridium chromiireducens]
MFKKKKDVEDNLDYYKAPKGNILTFFGGIVVFLVGIYMIFQNTIISTGFNLTRVFGFTPNFGLVLLPLLIGIIVLFFNEHSVIGWFLIIVGIFIILMGILMGLRMSFMPVSLFEGILMFGMTAAGIGITLKGLFGKNR